ncbi:MAG: cyclic 2,3-diphosphoglycerate synthase [Candidatus Marinimicrobia bacterium]|nr:cyclic 2,3-diphosphoglycerate synthase [Candidatus Neomarinimicrobiota bacterium]MCF7827333.1 cyclic 2,3-diphosphoglycerate synthase [Candidatus Neomarinimicrobiota bacterium]MCF7881434.1 cyclic 2,3-diphosphoglycerate synthase [Candidatus Neomarinimicrobiota bacterium]
MSKTTVIIMGAAGRDFHNFNTFYRSNDDYDVVAFTATQIPDIEGRKYPGELAGDLYPDGIPIEPEEKLPELITELNVDEVVFSYSDVPHEYVMHKASLVNSLGADFKVMGAKRTMLKSEKPVVAVCAVRTGCGKSQTTRRVAEILTDAGKQVVAIRHPMPYGDLAKQRVQRFETLDDLKKHDCTIEEMEEYEPHIDRGTIVYAGVDYEAILRKAEQEADVILWDGGNNDMPFYEPDIMITVTDPHRPGHETSYYPGESNLLMADVVLINKIDTADNTGVEAVRDAIRTHNPDATVVDGASPISVDEPKLIAGKRALVIEDGPTLTHGEMKYGAGVVAADKFGATELVDPRPYTTGTITETFEKYPEIGTLLPAMGYGEQQMKDLEVTIKNADCDVVIIGTPIDLRRIINIEQPSVRVTYDLQELGRPNLRDVLKPLL